MRKYKTKDGLTIKLLEDSVGRFWKACTNDFEFYDEYLADLDWLPKEEAQAVLDEIARKEGLEEIV